MNIVLVNTNWQILQPKTIIGLSLLKQAQQTNAKFIERGTYLNSMKGVTQDTL